MTAPSTVSTDRPAMQALVCSPRMRRQSPRGNDFHVERGRDLAFGEGASFALLGIPHDASRESIALAVTELAGFADTPLLVPLLVSAGSAQES
jgi:hypothetical protein